MGPQLRYNCSATALHQKDRGMDASTQVVIDTGFRSALRRMQLAGRIDTYAHEADTEFQIAGMMKKLDGGPALLFPRVKGHAKRLSVSTTAASASS